MKVFWLGLVWNLAIALEVQVLSRPGRYFPTAAIVFCSSFVGACTVQSLALGRDVALVYACGATLGALVAKMAMHRL